MENLDKKTNEHRKNSSEKDTNINSDFQKKYLMESPNSDDNEKDKPIHFQVEYDRNKNFEKQLESSPDTNNPKNKSHSPYTSNKKEQEFVIEKNNQTNDKNKNKTNNNKNQDYFQDNNNLENIPNNQFYNLLKDNLNINNNNINNNNNVDKDDNNFNNYYYYYLNNYNNRLNNNEEEYEPKKVISFATKTYQGRIDPVKLNRKYNNYYNSFQKQNKSRQKYKQKIDALQKVFHPYGYNSVTKSFKRKGMSQSRYSSRISVNNYDRPPFDNTKQPLPKSSYLVVPYDYGINDPNYGKEDPINYERKKMAKLRMLKQPLKYYYPYTNENIKKRNFKYE